jgi:hypothetical protein
MPLQNNTYSLAAVDPVYNPEDAMESMICVPLGNSLTLAKGTVLGKITATGKYIAYASGASDGSQLPVGILRRAATTDGSGNITNYSEWGTTGACAPIYTQGAFKIADLVGLDDNAVTKLAGHTDGNLIANSTTVFF